MRNRSISVQVLRFAAGAVFVTWLSSSALAQTLVGTRTQEFAVPDGQPAMRLPTAAALGANGELFVLDGAHDRVVRFDPAGGYLGELLPLDGTALAQPVGLRVDAHGRIWIADGRNSRLVALDAAGALLAEIRLPAGEEGRPADPTDMAWSPDGEVLWVVDNENHRLLRRRGTDAAWEILGRTGESLGQFQWPFQIVAAPSGDLYVSDVINARVQLWSARGQPIRNIGSYGVEYGQFYRPGGLALAPDGVLWVADSVTGVVQAFRPDGTWIDVLRNRDGAPLRFEAPLGLTIDPLGALFVVESRAARVVKLSIERSARIGPAPSVPSRAGPLAGQQAKACTICHIEWLPPFSDGRDSGLMPRPVAHPNEPVVARSDLCLSCHDGTVADSRFAVWDLHGHQTGITPPGSMQVPAHLPLVGGQLACRTCHSAHGAGVPQGDIRRAVFLRVPNPASELCISCHEDKTRGPRLGTHPTGGMPWPVPEELIAAGARVGPNPRELTCQVCHTPHGARHDHLLVLGTSTSQLCLTCHDQMRPGMFREDAHAEHPQSARLNEQQLEAVRRLGTATGPDGVLICLSCHKLHHGHGERFLLAEPLRDGQMCIRCHEERSAMLTSAHDLRMNFPHERNRLGLTATEGGPCSSCHLFHRYARELSPGPGDTAGHCLTCHQVGGCAEQRRLGPVNHPSDRCTDCHDPHETRHGSFLSQPPAQLCRQCHESHWQLLGGPHDALRSPAAWCDPGDHSGDRCLVCHRTHGDERHGLFRVAPAAGEAAADAACVACHPGMQVFANGPHALLHPRAAPGIAAGGLPLVAAVPWGHDPEAALNGSTAEQIGCVTCHDPHGGASAAGALLRVAAGQVAAELCLHCHADMRPILATAHSPEVLRRHGLGSAACGPCHQVHGDRAQTLPELLWPNRLAEQGRRAAVASGPAGAATHTTAGLDDVLCLSCHQPGGPAGLPATAWHPDVPMLAVGADPAAGLPLFGAAGAPDQQGGIGCRTCHLPHGRVLDDGGGSARADERRGQRLNLRPFDPPNTCTNCHGAEGLWRFLYYHNTERRRGEISAERSSGTR